MDIWDKDVVGMHGPCWAAMENSCKSLCLFPFLDSGLDSPIPSFSVKEQGVILAWGYSRIWVFPDVSSAPVSTVTHTMNSTRPLIHTLSFPVPHVPTVE